MTDDNKDQRESRADDTGEDGTTDTSQGDAGQRGKGSGDVPAPTGAKAHDHASAPGEQPAKTKKQDKKAISAESEDATAPPEPSDATSIADATDEQPPESAPAGGGLDTTTAGPASPGRLDAAIGRIGELLEPSRQRCQECGKERSKVRQRFCTQCRNPLPELTSTVSGPVATSAQTRAWALAAVVVVVLIMIAVATSSGASNTAANTTVPTSPPDTSSNSFTPPTDVQTTPTTPTTPTGTRIPESQLTAGNCFYFDGEPNIVDNAQPKTQVDTVPCDGPHPFETVSALTYPGAVSNPYPGDETVNAYANQQCTPLFTNYTSGSSLSLTNEYTYPSSSSWPTGDRTIVCYIKDSSGALLMSQVGGSTAATSPPASPPPSAQSTITSDGVYVRSGPGTSYSTITALNTGDQISIQCITQGDNIYGNSQWDQINVNGQTGYVSDEYVNDNGASPPSC